MQKQKINKFKLFSISFFLFSFFFFYPASADELNGENEETETSIDLYAENTVWHKDDNLTFNKIIYINPGATLTIEKGAQITLGKISEWENAYIDVSGGRIIANGTQAEPIKISSISQSDYYLLRFRYDVWEGIPPAEPSFLRYVEISGGGYDPNPPCLDCGAFWYNLIPPAYASAEGLSAMRFESGMVHMENCKFSKNVYADVGVEYSEYSDKNTAGSYLEIVNSNFEKNAGSLAVKSVMYCKIPGLNCEKKVLLKNNWYDGLHGPIEETVKPDADGKELVGTFQLDNWRASSVIADPVVIIPGIMGSTEVAGQLKLDPILHTYDDLVASLEKNGYEKNQNLFEFLYDWRKKNDDSAIRLKAKVESIIDSTKISKVDLVAHSMGGLVARAYVEDEGYKNIDQLITLGTPHRGSPEAYLKWEAGEGFFSRKDKIVKHHFEMEALHHNNHYGNLYDYIQEEVPSIKELLPDYAYLFDVSQNALRSYSAGHPQNTFLRRLNESVNVEKLKNVNFTNILGVLSGDKSTISNIRVVKSSVEDRWEDGMPEDFYGGTADQGLEYDRGDGTVPERSAEDILANKTLKTNSTHNDFPTVAQCAIFQELTGQSDCESVVKTHIANMLLFNIFSPIDIQVVEVKTGKRIGKDFEHPGQVFNEIPGAFYSGYDTDNEFITIPNPVDGEYKILAQGTGAGEYRIKATKIFETEDEKNQVSEASTEISGTTSVDEQTESAVKVSKTTVEDASRDNTPPSISGEATSQPNANGWHNQDVTIHFEATDASGIAEITPDKLLAEEGENQSVSGSATDTAGNTASVTVAGINIDKTAPETTVEIVGTKGQNNYYTGVVELKLIAGDNLSQTEKTFFSLDGAPDQIGTGFLLETGGEHLIKYFSLDRAGNSEAEKALNLKIDNTAPVAQILVPQNKTYGNNQILMLKYALTDETSPIDKIKTEVALDGQPISASKIDLSLEHLGTHTLSLSAQDESGNRSARTEVSFVSKTDIATLLSNVNHYFNLKLIKTKATKYRLELELKIIQEKMKLLTLFQSKWMPKFAKDRVAENLKKEINREIENLILTIQSKKKFQGTIDEKVGELLMEGLKILKL